jgi:hypothetical protein
MQRALVMKAACLAVAIAGLFPATQEALSLDSVPAPVRDTLEKQAGKHRIERVVKITERDGSVFYEGHFHKVVGGETAVEVAPSGVVRGVYNRQDQPSGTGP